VEKQQKSDIRSNRGGMKIRKYQESGKQLFTLFDCKEIKSNEEGLKLLLLSSDKKESLAILFKDYAGYRIHDEEDRQAFTGRNSESLANWPIYTIEESPYISWLIDEKGYIGNLKHLKHYMIITEFEIFDILSYVAPDIAIL
jgi:hypothetical protein